MPLFSVLIPTWNRADLLKFAIQSVLSQDFGDYELIVSDNDSSDNTREVAESFGDSRVRYVNTGKHLTGADSWNFAYKQATGDYILALGDDDYLVSDALNQVRKVIQDKSALMISWGLITYYDSSYNNVSLQNTINSRKFTGRIIEIEAKKVLKAYFDLDNIADLYPPHPSAICISRRVADEINNKYGAFYASPYGEITAIPRSLVYANSLVIIDKPLTIVGRTSRSAVAKFLWSTNDAWKEVAGEFLWVVFKGKYTYNLHTESLLRVKHSDPERFKDYDINLERYCCLYYQNMLNVSRAGMDTSNDLKEFYQKLSTLQSNVQRNVRRYIRKTQIKEFLRQSPLWNIAAVRVLILITVLKSMLNTTFKKSNNSVFIRGDSVDIHNIAECAEKLEDIKNKFNLINTTTNAFKIRRK